MPLGILHQQDKNSNKQPGEERKRGEWRLRFAFCQAVKGTRPVAATKNSYPAKLQPFSLKAWTLTKISHHSLIAFDPRERERDKKREGSEQNGKQ